MNYSDDTSTAEHDNTLAMDKVNLTSLEGQEIIWFTEQFKGKPLVSRVVSAEKGVLSIERGGSGSLIDSLIGNQKAVVQFIYKGQRISVDATLKREADGKCTLVLGEKLVPLSRRRFRRYELNRPVRCAPMSPADFDERRLSNLRWLETDSINFSSGGLLICLPKNVGVGSYLLLHIDLNEFNFPPLVVGQVRYNYSVDSFRFNIGVEFIVNDVKDRHFSHEAITRLPANLFEYDADRRKELNRELSVKMYRNPEKEQ